MEKVALTSAEAETQVAALLRLHCIKFEVLLIGPTLKTDTGAEPWECDQWVVKFTGEQASFDTMYYTGIGHRKAFRLKIFHGVMSQVEMHNPHSKGKTVHDRRMAAGWDNTHLKPQAPSAADVLHSLLLDSQAAEMSFMHWCGDLGYDTDSIRALNIYNACCKIGADMSKVFSADVRRQLNDLLEDY